MNLHAPEEVTTVQGGRGELAEASRICEKWGNPSQKFQESTGAQKEKDGREVGGGAKSKAEDEEGRLSLGLESAGGRTGVCLEEGTPATTLSGSQWL